MSEPTSSRQPQQIPRTFNDQDTACCLSSEQFRIDISERSTHKAKTHRNYIKSVPTSPQRSSKPLKNSSRQKSIKFNLNRNTLLKKFQLKSAENMSLLSSHLKLIQDSQSYSQNRQISIPPLALAILEPQNTDKSEILVQKLRLLRPLSHDDKLESKIQQQKVRQIIPTEATSNARGSKSWLFLEELNQGKKFNPLKSKKQLFFLSGKRKFDYSRSQNHTPNQGLSKQNSRENLQTGNYLYHLESFKQKAAEVWKGEALSPKIQKKNTTNTANTGNNSIKPSISRNQQIEINQQGSRLSYQSSDTSEKCLITAKLISKSSFGKITTPPKKKSHRRSKTPKPISKTIPTEVMPIQSLPTSPKCFSTLSDERPLSNRERFMDIQDLKIKGMKVKLPEIQQQLKVNAETETPFQFKNDLNNDLQDIFPLGIEAIRQDLKHRIDPPFPMQISTQESLPISIGTSARQTPELCPASKRAESPLNSLIVPSINITSKFWNNSKDGCSSSHLLGQRIDPHQTLRRIQEQNQQRRAFRSLVRGGRPDKKMNQKSVMSMEFSPECRSINNGDLIGNSSISSFTSSTASQRSASNSSPRQAVRTKLGLAPSLFKRPAYRLT